MADKQLWVVTDNANNWLWYGKGSLQDALVEAQKAEAYRPEAILHIFALSGEVVIAPVKGG